MKTDATRLIQSDMVHHYRDRHAAEAAVVEGPDRLRLVGTKAARTAPPGLFAGALRVRDELARPSRPCDVALVYAEVPRV